MCADFETACDAACPCDSACERRSTFTLNNSSTALANVDLRRRLGDFERVRVVPRRAMHALFRHQRTQDHLVGRASDVSLLHVMTLPSSRLQSLESIVHRDRFATRRSACSSATSPARCLIASSAALGHQHLARLKNAQGIQIRTPARPTPGRYCEHSCTPACRRPAVATSMLVPSHFSAFRIAGHFLRLRRRRTSARRSPRLAR